MLSIEDFLPSEEMCAEVLRGLRWSGGVECVWCECRDVVKNDSYMHHYQKYMCRGGGSPSTTRPEPSSSIRR